MRKDRANTFDAYLARRRKIKLTNMQIRATIDNLVAALDRDGAAGMASTAAARRRRQQLVLYREELFHRERSGENPGTEIQDVLHGEPRRKRS